jgi:hypothetical protein
MTTNCTTVQQNLDDLRAGRLSSLLAEPMRAHLQRCPRCSAFGDDVDRLKAALATPLAPAPASLIQQLQNHRRPAARRRASLALAASLLLAVAAVALTLAPSPGPSPLAQPEQWREHTLRLALDSPRTLEDVSFRLELPAGAEIQGRPGERVLQWTDDLAAGANRLTIPLRLQAGAHGEMVTTLEHEGRSRELRVSLDTLSSPVHDDAGEGA